MTDVVSVPVLSAIVGILAVLLTVVIITRVILATFICTKLVEQRNISTLMGISV